MKKLPTSIGIIIFLSTLLVNWFFPNLARILNIFLIWAILICLCYTLYYWFRYWSYVRQQKQ